MLESPMGDTYEAVPAAENRESIVPETKSPPPRLKKEEILGVCMD